MSRNPAPHSEVTASYRHALSFDCPLDAVLDVKAAAGSDMEVGPFISHLADVCHLGCSLAHPPEDGPVPQGLSRFGPRGGQDCHDDNAE